MKAILCVALLALAAVPVPADHEPGCQPQRADPATMIQVTMPTGEIYYLEERDVPPPFNPVTPIPGSGTLFGGGTWVYQEINGIEGLQRGGEICYGVWFGPVTCPDPHTTLDPVQDENCGFGADFLIF